MIGGERVSTKKFWQFKAQADNVGELLIYGPIASSTWWGDEVTPRQFKQELNALGDVSEINVFINSDGGDVFAAQAILSMLKRHDAIVSVFIDGLAASAASVIAMAGDEVFMPANAMMMIHNPWTIAMGNASEFRKLADDLDKIRDSIVAAYAEKTGLDPKQVIEIMDNETWLTAEEAVELGFADEIEAEKQVAASLNGSTLVVNGQEMDVGRFENFAMAKMFGQDPHNQGPVVNNAVVVKPGGPPAEMLEAAEGLKPDLKPLELLEASLARTKQRYS